MDEQNMVLLFSGGIDSYIAWHYMHYPPTVYFNLGTNYSIYEQTIVSRLIPKTIIDHSLNLRDRGHHGEDNAYIPFRNLYLALLAYKYADTIIMAGLRDDKVSDKNPDAFKKFTDLLSEMEGKQIIVMSPFWQMTKADIVGWYLKQGLDSANLLNTISCYTPDLADDGKYCGMCRSCFRKWNALWDNGIELEFINNLLLEGYLKRARHGYYIPERNKSIIRCVEAFNERRGKNGLGGRSEEEASGG